MSKLIPSLSGVACLAWVTVWTWWLSAENPSQVPQNAGTFVTSLTITDGEQQFSTKEIFSFHLSDDMPVTPPPSLDLLQSIAEHLKINPEKELTLTGKYLETERNQSPYPNLGLARATAIKKLLTEQGAKDDQIEVESEIADLHYLVEDRLLSGVDFQFSQKIQEEEGEEGDNLSEPSNKEETGRSRLVIDEKGKLENILFSYDKEIFTLNRENRPILDDLRRLVRKNPDMKLIISGYSSKDEEKNIDGNLAERRSLAVRRYLVDTGVRRKNIIIESYPGAALGADQQRVEISVLD